MTKRVHRTLRIVRILVQQPQAEPRVRIFGIVLPGRFQKCFGGINAGQVQQGDALIQRCDLQLGIERGGFLKGFSPFSKSCWFM